MPTTEENREYLENLILERVERENEKLWYWVEYLGIMGAEFHQLNEARDEDIIDPAVNEKLVGMLKGIETGVSAAQAANDCIIRAKEQILALNDL
jgi:hypothetical protein